MAILQFTHIDLADEFNAQQTCCFEQAIRASR